MEEKILAKSKRYNVGKGLFIFSIIAVMICILWYIVAYSSYIADYQSCEESCSQRGYWGKCYIHRYYDSAEEYASRYTSVEIWWCFGIAAGVCLFCLLIYFWLRSYEMIVTDKRVYGRAAFGKRVDLPVDSVSAVGSKWPKGISVATSSGKIAFLMIKNRDEIHKCVSDLLIERQGKPIATAAPVVKQVALMSNAEELKKYKELLDMGAITQEEFDAKKKQLLGL